MIPFFPLLPLLTPVARALLSFFPPLRSLYLLLALRRLPMLLEFRAFLPWSRTLDILLPGVSLFRRTLYGPLPELLPHDRVMRMVTVISLYKLALLFYLPGITIP